MNQNESLKTAFGYIRVSTHMQEEISPEAQKHEPQKWAKQRHNILITQWFQDNGISGKKAENRTAFQNMIALAKEKDHPTTSLHGSSLDLPEIKKKVLFTNRSSGKTMCE